MISPIIKLPAGISTISGDKALLDEAELLDDEELLDIEDASLCALALDMGVGFGVGVALLPPPPPPPQPTKSVVAKRNGKYNFFIMWTFNYIESRKTKITEMIENKAGNFCINLPKYHDVIKNLRVSIGAESSNRGRI